MKLNHRMKVLFEEHAIRITDSVAENSTYPIWRKTDSSGRFYWGVSSFWGLDKQQIPSDIDLSQLEWDGNEIHLDAQTDAEVPRIFVRAIEIINFWRHELEIKYPETPFYIFASYDNGDMFVLEEGELPAQSITLRFWAHRSGNPIIPLEHFDSWDQPAIIECCNGAAQIQSQKTT